MKKLYSCSWKREQKNFKAYFVPEQKVWRLIETFFYQTLVPSTILTFIETFFWSGFNSFYDYNVYLNIFLIRRLLLLRLLRGQRLPPSPVHQAPDLGERVRAAVQKVLLGTRLHVSRSVSGWKFTQNQAEGLHKIMFNTYAKFSQNDV